MKHFKITPLIFCFLFLVLTVPSNASNAYREKVSTLELTLETDRWTDVRQSFFSKDKTKFTVVHSQYDLETYKEHFYLSTYDVASGKLITEQHLGVLNRTQIFFNNDNTMMAIYDKTITLYAVEPFTKIYEIPLDYEREYYKNEFYMSFSKDSNLLAYASDYNTVSLFDLKNNKVIDTYNIRQHYKPQDGWVLYYKDGTSDILNVYFHPDNKRVLIDFEIKSVNKETMSIVEFAESAIWDTELNTSTAIDGAYYPWPYYEESTDFLIEGIADVGKIKFYPAPTRNGFIRDLGFHFIVYNDDGSIRKQVYAPSFTKEGKLKPPASNLEKDEYSGGYMKLDFTKDAKHLVIGYTTDYIMTYDLDTLEIIKKDYTGESFFNSMFLENQGILVGNGNWTYLEDKQIKVGKHMVYDLKNSKMLTTWQDTCYIYCYDEETGLFVTKNNTQDVEVWRFVKDNK